jgi:hypothetical protein
MKIQDTVEDCNTPELFRLGKLPNTILNKLKGFEI